MTGVASSIAKTFAASLRSAATSSGSIDASFLRAGVIARNHGQVPTMALPRLAPSPLAMDER